MSMYKVIVSNPKSDAEKKISGKIEFKSESRPENNAGKTTIIKIGYAIGTLSNLPNPFTNPLSGSLVSVSTIGPLQSAKIKSPNEEDIVQSMVQLLRSEFLMNFGQSIDLVVSLDNEKPTNLISGTDSNTFVPNIVNDQDNKKVTEFMFNVEVENMFKNFDMGDLIIISKDDESFIFDDTQETIDPEYLEGAFEGSDESEFAIPIEDEIEFDNAVSSGEVSASSLDDNTPINPGTLKGNMKLIAEAAKSVGFTSKYAIYSIIAIASGESKLKPQNEGHVYGRGRIGSVFSGLSQNQMDRATVRGISKRSFFNIIYGEYKPGRVGNRNVNDGGLYFGRGFIQITGYGLYLELNNLMKRYFPRENINILDNPDLLNNPEISAKVTALFYIQKGMLNVKQDSSFFEKALRKTGNDAGGGYAKKRKFYSKLLSENNIA